MFFPAHRTRNRKARAMVFLSGLAGCIALALATGLLTGSIVAGSIVAIVVGCGYYAVARVWMVGRDKHLPVLIYHSISSEPGWLMDQAGMSLSPEAFEGQMRYLAKHGYKTLSLDEAFARLEGTQEGNAKEIVLTFDDGYLDNRVAAQPILEKCGFRGTIFVPIDFVDRRDAIRPTLKDVEAGRATPESLEWRGYLTWPELSEMEKNGVLSVQSHGKTHTWFPCGDQPVDFYRPGDGRVWMAWNANPHNKPTWFEDKAAVDAKLMGRPVFPSARSHRVRKVFHPNPELGRRLNAIVRDEGGAEFFQKAGWRERLTREMRESGLEMGWWETDEEAAARLQAEFADSRRILERRLDKHIRYFCWPGDEHEPWLHEAALRAGYMATTDLESPNKSGEKTERIGRVYAPACHPSLGMDRLNVVSFVLTLKLFEGRYYYYFPFVALSLIIKILNKLRGVLPCRTSSPSSSRPSTRNERWVPASNPSAEWISPGNDMKSSLSTTVRPMEPRTSRASSARKS